MLAKTAARVLLCANGFLGLDYVEMVRRAEIELPALEEIVILDRVSPEGTMPWDEFLDRGGAIDEAVVRERIAAIGPDEVSDIIFTSGTTGQPKGVMLRHGASMRCFGEYYNRGFQLRRGDRALVVHTD